MILREFQYILAIADEGNITKAAERLYISQPSLSHFLNEYEKEYGAKIFNRSHFGVEPTDFGLQVIELAQYTLRSIDAIVEKNRASTAQTGTLVRIGIPDQRGITMTPYFLSRAKQVLPHVHFHVLEDIPERLSEAFLANNCDFFSLASISSQSPYPQFNCSFLCTEEILLAIPPGHPLLQRVKTNTSDQNHYIPVNDLKGQTFYLCSSERGVRRFSDKFLADKHIPYTTIGESSNIATAINGCLIFNALTFVPKQFAQINGKPVYVSIGRKRAYWYVHLVSKEQIDPLLYEGVVRILREGFQ